MWDCRRRTLPLCYLHRFEHDLRQMFGVRSCHASLSSDQSEFQISSYILSADPKLQEWEGSYYKRTMLTEVGLVVQLGHRTGDSCLNPADERSIVVIDVDGVHEVRVQFCGCHLASPLFKQLLRARWFPVTVELPRTAITFRVLQHFQMLSFMSKVSAYKYYQGATGMKKNDIGSIKKFRALVLDLPTST